MTNITVPDILERTRLGSHMRSRDFLLSFCLHLGVVLLGLFWSGLSTVNVDLNQPVYQVDLVSLGGPTPGPGKPVPSAGKPGVPKPAEAPAKPVEKPAEQPSQPEAPKAVPVPDKPQPVPDKPQAVPQKPEPPAKPEPVQKPEPVKTPPKPAEKPQDKAISEKADAKAKVEKKKEAKPEPSPESVMAEALKSVKTDVSKTEKSSKSEAAGDLSRELANLRKESGDIYETGDGGDTTGEAAGGGGTGTGGLSEVFGAIVGQQIKIHWRWPDYASDSNLQCVVQLQIGPDGSIQQYALYKGSGRPEFDSSALNAVRETEKVAPPPNRRLQTVYINFNSQELMN